MCGRFTLRQPLTVLARQLQLDLDAALADAGPRYNIAPTQDVAAVRLAADGRRELATLRWGLIPAWAKDPKSVGTLINARAESVAAKPAFRAAFKRRRCLILADGFYEWLREGKSRQPYLYEMHDCQPFAFAGLWESWCPSPGSRPLESCTIITTTANDVVRPVHDRMPVILDTADYGAWLDAQQSAEALQQLLQPYPANAMTARAINEIRRDAPQ